MKQWIIGIVFALLAAPATAYEPLVAKKVFEMPRYTTVGGKTIQNVRVGWEAYGTLNAAKDNAILICHYFSGNSHAAGKYAAADQRPGYWDAIIGSGRPVDTDQFYVVFVDSLVNLGTGNPRVVTTGPASTNPQSGQPYAMAFPIVTIRDFVNVQKALLESLGVTKLHAVMGPSMGALQTYEWANSTFGRAWATEGQDPAASFTHQFKIESVLDSAGLARAKVSDANHFLYLVKANQLFLAGHGQSYIEGLRQIEASTLIIHTDEDLIFFPEEVRETAALINSDGTPVEIVELQGTRGHLDGVLNIGQAGERIKAFLEN